MDNQSVAFNVPTAYEDRLAAIDRAQRMADILQQQAFEPLRSTGSYNGIPAPISPLSGLAKMLNAYSARKGLEDVEAKRTALSEEQRAGLENYLNNAPKGTEAIPGTPGMPATMGTTGAVNDYFKPPESQNIPGLAMPLDQAMPSLGTPGTAATEGTPGTPAQPPTRAQMLAHAMQGVVSGNPRITPLATAEYSRLVTPDELMVAPAGSNVLNKRTGAVVSSTPYKPQFDSSSNLQKLIDYRATLPPGSADYKTVTNAIDKESTRVPNMLTMLPPPDKVESLADMIGTNQIPPLSGNSLRTPFGLSVMAKVKEKYPDYSSADIGGQKAAVIAFSKGKQGDTVRSLNVAINHLDQLGGLSDALNNNDIKAVNKIGNVIATQFGVAAPTNFEAAKKIVADEIVKSIVGSGGGIADREEASRSISAASSPAQLKGVIDTYTGLMSGQLSGLQQQYETGTGKKDFDKFLSDKTKERIGGHSAAGSPPLSTLQEGHETTFGNGQIWKMENGKAVQVK